MKLKINSTTLGLSVAAALIALSVPNAFGGIAATKHNLMSTSGNTIKTDGTTYVTAGATEEICVFCHTPHASNTDFTGAPLWNKATPGSAFTLYGDTIAGNATDATLNPQSKACLSCHDGVSAINSIVNMQGSGLDTGTIELVGTEAGFVMPNASVTNIGTNLTNDHPVSIKYIAGNASLRATDYTLSTTTAWSGATTIADLLRGATNDRVECGSCHDPHSSANGRFLRASNDASKLCISCHDK